MKLWPGAVLNLVTAPLLPVNRNDFLMEGNGRKQMDLGGKFSTVVLWYVHFNIL